MSRISTAPHLSEFLLFVEYYPWLGYDGNSRTDTIKTSLLFNTARICHESTQTLLIYLTRGYWSIDHEVCDKATQHSPFPSSWDNRHRKVSS